MARTVTFDYAAGRRVLDTFIRDLAHDELTWAWNVTVGCLDVVGHHSTPFSDPNRKAYTAEAWEDWYGSFLCGADAQHTVHGLAKELRDACPPDLLPVLRREIEKAYLASDTRTEKEKAAAIAAHRAATAPPTPVLSPAPAKVANPFTVLVGGKS